VKYGLIHDPSIPQMLHDDALEQRRCHAAIPHTVGIDNYDWSAAANAEAWRLSSLDAAGPEEEALTLKQRRQQLIQLAPAMVRRTESANAYEHMARIRLHGRTKTRGTHGGNLV
jgi:hypothetical protein